MIEIGLTDYDDPLMLGELFWPDMMVYGKQEEIVYSVRDNDETLVTAGNMLGKDYIAAFIATTFFWAPQLYFDPRYVAEVESRRSEHNPNPHTVRVITTSVKDDHLRVLWGEIGRFIQSSAFPLEVENGGPFICNHRDIRKLVNNLECKISYLRGMVSERGEGMAGHHAAYTLLIMDEASGIDDTVYTQGCTWAKKVLAIGNPNPCENFFIRGVEAGDLLAS